MVAKVGRPASDNPKNIMFRVRMDKTDLQMLDECCKELNLSRSEVVRKLIVEQYTKIKE